MNHAPIQPPRPQTPHRLPGHRRAVLRHHSAILGDQQGGVLDQVVLPPPLPFPGPLPKRHPRHALRTCVSIEFWACYHVHFLRALYYTRTVFQPPSFFEPDQKHDHKQIHTPTALLHFAQFDQPPTIAQNVGVSMIFYSIFFVLGFLGLAFLHKEKR